MPARNFEPVAQAPYEALTSDFDLVRMAEAEEHSLALDRRQLSVAEAQALGGRRRHHAAETEPMAYAVETPQNTHHLAGLAEANASRPCGGRRRLAAADREKRKFRAAQRAMDKSPHCKEGGPGWLRSRR